MRPPSSFPTVNNTASNNAEIRRLKRSLRRDLSPNQQKLHAQCLAKKMAGLAAYRNSQDIACYLANDGEIITSHLIEHARQMKKNIYLPVLSPLKNSLYFAPYPEDCQLKNNRFGIPEPDCHPSQWRKAWQLNLLLLPLVAFDNSGNRIGMGGGFYDRTLSYLTLRQQHKKPILVGLAHEIQKCESLTTRNWDIPLDIIVTEAHIYR